MKQSQTNSTTKERCRVFRRQGLSIGEIAKKLQLSESTVHWHVKGIVLTKAQQQKLRDRWRLVMVKVNARRRGRALKPVAFLTPPWSVELVHLIGHLSFDGRVDRYGCSYYSRAKNQALHVKWLMHRLLAIRPKVRLRPNGIWVVSYYNVEVAAWVAQREWQLLTVVDTREDWYRQWLQAFFDDEGHVHISKHIRRVRASQHDPHVLQHAQRFLDMLGIKSRIDQSAQAVEITGRENLIEFRNRINFSPGIRVNAHRKNGLWDRGFEKRKLLDLALGSYKTIAL